MFLWKILVIIFLIVCSPQLIYFFILGYSKPNITVNPTIIRESDTVKLSCLTSQFPHPSECSFYIEKDPPTVTPCQYKVKAVDLLKRAKRKSPANISISCSYIITESNQRYPSETSGVASLTVLGKDGY